VTDLVITRGYPASGKTTYARNWVAEDPEHRVRVNRDDLRWNLYGMYWGLNNGQEWMVTKAQHGAVRNLLTAGQSVIVDDTNLRLKSARAWADMAQSLGVDFEVVDIETPTDVCAERDRWRIINGDRAVGDGVIKDFARRFPIGRWPEVTPSQHVDSATPEFYVPDASKPVAWIVDIDGTLAHLHERSPFTENSGEYLTDTVDETVADLVYYLNRADYVVILLSGRGDQHREVTKKWLRDNYIRYVHLFMRPEGDNRKDYIVKAELFDKHVRHNYNVVGVLDDRDQVVKMWRSIGLKCLQVQDGDF